jgi:hypothetical protein
MNTRVIYQFSQQDVVLNFSVVRMKELNEPKNRPILKAEKKWSIPSLVVSLLQRTPSNSLKNAIFDPISSGFMNKLLFDV